MAYVDPRPSVRGEFLHRKLEEGGMRVSGCTVHGPYFLTLACLSATVSCQARLHTRATAREADVHCPHFWKKGRAARSKGSTQQTGRSDNQEETESGPENLALLLSVVRHREKAAR